MAPPSSNSRVNSPGNKLVVVVDGGPNRYEQSGFDLKNPQNQSKEVIENAHQLGFDVYYLGTAAPEPKLSTSVHQYQDARQYFAKPQALNPLIQVHTFHGFADEQGSYQSFPGEARYHQDINATISPQPPPGQLRILSNCRSGHGDNVREANRTLMLSLSVLKAKTNSVAKFIIT